MRLRIFRYDPDRDAKPYMKDYDVRLEPSDRMLLDALVKVKAEDDTFAFRRSCREGVCGSDAMTINGKNGLACITKLVELPEPVVLVEPGQVRGPGGAAAGVPVHRRQPRPGDRRAPRQPRGPVSPVPLPLDHELRRRLPEGAQPDEGDRQDQGADGPACRLSAGPGVGP